ncbi:MAG: OmpH family outer membrane protein [Ilyomonas sp.]
MNKILLTLNIILLIAVGALYYLYYLYTNSDEHKITEANKAVANSYKVAYFELDSLQNQYEFYKEIRDYLNSKDAQITKKLNELRNNYMNKVKEYQQKGPTMSQTEQGEFQQVLMNMQNNYSQQEHDLGQDMQAEQMRKLQEVKKKIQDFLKTYCRDQGYAYVFASDDYDNLYYKDTVRDITPEVVRLLNEDYKKSKKP